MQSLVHSGLSVETAPIVMDQLDKTLSGELEKLCNALKHL